MSTRTRTRTSTLEIVQAWTILLGHPVPFQGCHWLWAMNSMATTNAISSSATLNFNLVWHHGIWILILVLSLLFPSLICNTIWVPICTGRLAVAAPQWQRLGFRTRAHAQYEGEFLGSAAVSCLRARLRRKRKQPGIVLLACSTCSAQDRDKASWPGAEVRGPRQRLLNLWSW